MLAVDWPRASEPIAAVVTRGAGIEAWHSASVAVVGGDSALTHAFGDPECVTFARSSIKPFQALALELSGARAALGIDAEELAIACGSHNGSDAHRSVVERLLAKASARASDLQCGAHWPGELRLANRYPLAGEDRDPLRNNCSGKHAGFLALAHALGAPQNSYLDVDSPVQRAVKAAVAAACEIDEASLRTGTDGCSAPNFGMPLSALARGIKNLATCAHGDPALERALSNVRGAMHEHPLMVSGNGRFDYELMRSFAGNIVCKGGAEGLQVLGFREPALGIAVKVHDGAERALAPICMAVLAALGLVDKNPPPLLAERARPTVRNLRGLATGEIVAQLTLNRVLPQSGVSGAVGP